MKRVLENDFLKVTIDDHGAELVSIYDKEKDREVIWQGDPRFWGRHAPVLFPNVGKHYGNHYRIGDKEYASKQHGFARDTDFTCIDSTLDSVTHQIRSTEETKEVYPFDFVLRIRHILKGRTLTVSWKVANNSDTDMYFAIGGHPAFRCPLDKNQVQTDYYIGFDMEGRGNPKYHSISRRGLYEPREYELPLEQGLYRFDKETFTKDTLIFEKQTTRVYLMRPDKRPYVTVTFAAPLFGVWSPPGKQAPFVCIEPWYGRCDREGFSGDLIEKDWIQCLQPNEIFEAAYFMEFS